jgi:hypothetical protein
MRPIAPSERVAHAEVERRVAGTGVGIVANGVACVVSASPLGATVVSPDFVRGKAIGKRRSRLS